MVVCDGWDCCFYFDYIYIDLNVTMKNYIIHIGAFVIAIIFFVNIGCNQFYDEAKYKKKNLPDLGQIDALPLDYKSPEDNPTSKEKIELGRLLFYDPILSGNKDVSCASCHHPEFGYSESLEVL